MQRVLKTYNKDALFNNIRNIEVTHEIIRRHIKKDGFNIINNKIWNSWYLVPKDLGIYNVYEEIGKHSSEADLLKYYLINRM